MSVRGNKKALERQIMASTQHTFFDWNKKKDKKCLNKFKEIINRSGPNAHLNSLPRGNNKIHCFYSD